MARLALIALVFFGCGRSERPAATAAPPTVTLYGMQVRSYRGSELVAAGRAAKLTYVRGSADFVGSEVLMRFPSQAGIGVKSGLMQGGMEVRAPTVTGNQAARKATGSDGVVMRSADGVVATSQTAEFDGVRRVADGDQRIIVDGPRYALSADRYHLEFATQQYDFFGHVESRLGTEGKK